MIPNQTPTELAAALNIRVIRDNWQVAEGAIVMPGECQLNPPEVRLNEQAIRQIAKLAAADFSDPEIEWATETRITEIVLAHELYHILHHATGPQSEPDAHAFVREWLRMPFSPLRYEQLLQNNLRIK